MAGIVLLRALRGAGCAFLAWPCSAEYRAALSSQEDGVCVKGLRQHKLTRVEVPQPRRTSVVDLGSRGSRCAQAAARSLGG